MSATRRIRRRPLPAFAALLLIALLLALRWQFGAPTTAPPALPTEGEYEVVRVVDGDTLIVRPLEAEDAGQGNARLRLLGIDSPETVKPDHPVEPWGPEATEFTRRFVAGGRVRLQLDRRRLDKYDRMLAYLFVDQKMLNEELVRAGLARVNVFEGDSQSIARQLYQAQDEARHERRGIWSEGGERP